MTRKEAGTLVWKVAKIAGPALALLGGGGKWYDSRLVHRDEYQLDRTVRDTTLSKLDRRTRKLVCAMDPKDPDEDCGERNASPRGRP